MAATAACWTPLESNRQSFFCRRGSVRTTRMNAILRIFASLMVFTVQSSARAAFEEGVPNGVPPEIFIYAQGSAGLGLAVTEGLR